MAEWFAGFIVARGVKRACGLTASYQALVAPDDAGKGRRQ